LAAAGGTLESGPAPRRGFRVTAQLPVDVVDLDLPGAARDPAPVAGAAPVADTAQVTGEAPQERLR
ncbi:sensor histidine kinase, partial [Streptomyces sp. T-3]|nr:sensor histidine kinase [Streptomyces sp. T-3]